MLLVLGACLIACCVAVAHFTPATFQAAFLQMRVLTALGGALLGTALPGIIGLEVKGIRAVGAVSFVVLFFLFTPSLTGAPQLRELDTQTTVDARTRVSPVPVANAGEAAPKPSTQSYVNSPSCQGDNCNIDTVYGSPR